MFRLLITGSRTWVDIDSIREQFKLVYAKYGKNVTIVSGGCKNGADFLCEQLAKQAGWVVETHPANWNELGKSAGFKRNQQMVDLGADACLAFIADNSKGATHCSTKAIEANIPTKILRGNSTAQQLLEKE
jgi:hypothetical protein